MEQSTGAPRSVNARTGAVREDNNSRIVGFRWRDILRICALSLRIWSPPGVPITWRHSGDFRQCPAVPLQRTGALARASSCSHTSMRRLIWHCRASADMRADFLIWAYLVDFPNESRLKRANLSCLRYYTLCTHPRLYRTAQAGLLPMCVRNCSYHQTTKAYCKSIVKRSKLLDRMAAEARAEVIRIETARLEAHRVLERRKVELSNLVRTRKRKSLIAR